MKVKIGAEGKLLTKGGKLVTNVDCCCGGEEATACDCSSCAASYHFSFTIPGCPDTPFCVDFGTGAGRSSSGTMNKAADVPHCIYLNDEASLTCYASTNSFGFVTAPAFGFCPLYATVPTNSSGCPITGTYPLYVGAPGSACPAGTVTIS